MSQYENQKRPLCYSKKKVDAAADKISPEVIVARKLKRLPTIIDKLERPTLNCNSSNAIKFTRM